MADVGASPLKPFFPLKLDHFHAGATLGIGSFSRVRLVTHKIDESVWAMKVINKADVYRLKQVEHVLNERAILDKIKCPFAVGLAGTFQDERCLYMVLNFVAGGEYYTHLRSAVRFENNVAKFYVAQCALFLEYMHKGDFVYRDLKPENVLLDSRGYVRVTDFGFAKKVAFKTYTLCGTPEYMAPEVILCSGHGAGVDWWALGVFAYESLVGQPPWVDDRGPMGIYQQILNGRLLFPRFVDASAKDLVKRLLVTDLTRRFGCLVSGAGDVKEHTWFSGLDWRALADKDLTAPLVPSVGGDLGDLADTSNFDAYPDPLSEPPLPSEVGLQPPKDPFPDF